MSANGEPPPDDSQATDTSDDQKPSSKNPSLGNWWAEQKAAGARDWQRLREWWGKKTTIDFEPNHPPEHQATAEPKKPTTNAEPSRPPKQQVAVEPEKSTSSRVEATARLAVWAPTAVVLAVIGAFLTTAILLWIYYYIHSAGSVDIYRIVAAIAMAATFGLLMFWFASTPNAPATSKRFWFLLRIQIVILGTLALISSIIVGLMMIGVIDKFDSDISLVQTNII
ncbi:MAG: hypothetical protein O2812_01130 [Chloroflexi bacterium]|nr:hypothetical protein [Chloroflexota bacterium]